MISGGKPFVTSFYLSILLNTAVIFAGALGQLREGSGYTTPVSCSIAKGIIAAGGCGRIERALCNVRKNNSPCKELYGRSDALRGKLVALVQIRLNLASEGRSSRCLDWTFHFGVRNFYKRLDAMSMRLLLSDKASKRHWSLQTPGDIHPAEQSLNRSKRRTLRLEHQPKRLLVSPDDGVEIPVVFSRRPLVQNSNKISVGLCVVHKHFADPLAATGFRHIDTIRSHNSGKRSPTALNVEILPHPFLPAALNCWDCSDVLKKPVQEGIVEPLSLRETERRALGDTATPLYHVLADDGVNGSDVVRGAEPEGNVTDMSIPVSSLGSSSPRTLTDPFIKMASDGRLITYSSHRVADDDLALLWTGARLYVTLSLIILLLTFCLAFFYLLCRERNSAASRGQRVVSRGKPWNSLKFLREKEVSPRGSLDDVFTDPSPDGRNNKKVEIVQTPQDALSLVEAEAAAGKLKSSSVSGNSQVHYQVTALDAFRKTNHYDDVDIISSLQNGNRVVEDLSEYALLRADAPVKISRKGSYEHVYDLPPTKDGELLSMAGKEDLLAGAKYETPDCSETNSSSCSRVAGSVQPSPANSAACSDETPPVDEKGVYKSLLRTADYQEDGITDKTGLQSEVQRAPEQYVALYRSPTKSN